MITDVPEEYFDVEKEGQVEIIGWLYQFYNTEPKDLAFKKKKYTASDIPAVTQLFTPEWIVKYLVQNSLGRYWINVLQYRNNDIDEKNTAEEFGWQYYMPAASKNKQEVDKDLANVDVRDITFIDPAMGSGHILVYAFEVFLQIYKSEGYTEREAANLILQKNLFGADIDTRAFQLTYFTLMMQGRKKDRRFFNRNISLNIVDIPQVSDNIELLLSNVQENHNNQINVDNLRNVINKFTNGNTLGSLIKTDLESSDELKQLLDANDTAQLTLGESELAKGKVELESVINSVNLLSKKYTISVSNPPYMGSGKMDSELKKYVLKNYPNSKSDLFAVFIERLIELTKKNGYIAMITQHSWMFLSSFDKLRQKLQNKTIINLAHLGPRAFEEIGGEVVQSVSFVLQNKKVEDYIGTYERLTDFNTAADKEKKYLEAVNEPDLNYVFRSNQTNFEKIPGAPIGYWASKEVISSFNDKRIEDFGFAGIGMRTGDNKRFLRLWFEVSLKNECLDNATIDATKTVKWVPYNKGGNYRKWYGNNEYVVNWKNNGLEIKENTKRVYPELGDNLGWKISNEKYYFKPGITWTGVTSGTFNARIYNNGFIFDSGANGLFAYNKEDEKLLLGFLNSSTGNFLVNLLNPTINTGSGTIKELPVKINNDLNKNLIAKSVTKSIDLSVNDWNSQEISWNFTKHSLLNHIAEHNLSPPSVIMFFYTMCQNCAKNTLTEEFKMVSYQKRGKVWQYEISYKDLDGTFKKLRKSGFKLKSDAVQAASVMQASSRILATRSLSNQSLATYFDRWILLYKQNSVSNITFMKYQNTAKHIRKIFQNVSLNELSKELYQEKLNKFAETHAKRTVSCFHKHIKAALSYAIDDGIIDKDPTRKAVITGREYIPAQKFLNYNEWKKLIHSLSFEDPGELMIYLAALTGMRYAEIAAITPDHINFLNNTIKIDRTWDYKYRSGFKPTKNVASSRVIAIDSKTTKVLQSFIVKKRLTSTDLLFKVNDQIYYSSQINEILTNKLADLSLPRITFHGLRHTHASILLYQGVSVLSVSKRLGHSNTTTTQSTYLHIIKELETKDTDQILKILSESN